MSTLIIKRTKLNFKSKINEPQLEDQTQKKAQKEHLEEGKNHKTSK
jgi:hypothetical protein